MGTEWHRNIFPPLEKGTIGSDMKDLGDYYLDTQGSTGIGVWDTELVENSIARSQLEKQLKNNGKGIQAAKLLYKANPSYGRVASNAGAHRTNELSWLPWKSPSIYNKDDRLSVGEYSVGGWNLIPDYIESQTRGQDQYVRNQTKGMSQEEKLEFIRNSGDGSRYYTGETPTYKDIKPANIWDIL
jgi:hypothetical protein